MPEYVKVRIVDADYAVAHSMLVCRDVVVRPRCDDTARPFKRDMSTFELEVGRLSAVASQTSVGGSRGGQKMMSVDMQEVARHHAKSCKSPCVSKRVGLVGWGGIRVALYCRVVTICCCLEHYVESVDLCRQLLILVFGEMQL